MHRSFRSSTRAAAALFIIIAVGACRDAAAENFCVTNVAQLEQAFDDAGLNDDDDVIRIHVGLYDLPDGMTYMSDGAESGSLTISGGWFSFPTACAMQFADASLTVLDGHGTGHGLKIFLQSPDHGAVSLGNLSIVDTLSSLVFAGGLGVVVPTAAAPVPTIDLYNLRVQHCATHVANGCGVVTNGPAHLRLRNVLVADTRSDDPNGTAGISVRMNPSGSIHAQHVTVAGNSTLGSGISGLSFGNDLPVTVENSILYGNRNTSNAPSSCDLGVRAATSVRNSIVDQLCGTPTQGQVTVMDVDPVFVGSDYRFGPDSPARDAGLTATAIPMVVKDLGGDDRVQGAKPDLGAYEGPELPEQILASGFE